QRRRRRRRLTTFLEKEKEKKERRGNLREAEKIVSKFLDLKETRIRKHRFFPFFNPAEMGIQRLELCLELLRMAINFVVVVAESVGDVIHRECQPQALPTAGGRVPVPFVGFYP
uniref:Uncharacterized protein n=3 Tax=Cucumis TaxID=3655 RepID=A0A9I9DGS5_CUCME